MDWVSCHNVNIVQSFMITNNFSYGFEGDDEWQEYFPISSCFSCVSYNGDNMDCERPGTVYKNVLVIQTF